MPQTPSVLPGKGERKLAVLMFADLTGYTELCRRLDPEDVVATVHPVMAAMREAVEAEGGVVPSVAGDGFMAVFGVPTSHPDLAARALSSAQAMRRLIDERNRTVRTFRIPDVHIGIAAGEVLVVPSDDAVGWSLVGNAVNLASRLCDAASAGEILVDAQFRDLAGAAAADANARRVGVSGVGDALSVWVVATAEPATTATAAQVPFVNRVDSLRALDDAWSDVTVRGTSRVVVVGGETGIGKSRLVGTWLERAGHRSIWSWSGSESGGSLTAMAETVAARDPATSGEALEQLRVVSRPTGSVLRADPFPAVAVATRRILDDAADRPLVLVLDDAHRADTALLAFLEQLREQPLERELLVVATWRTDEVEPPWPVDVVLTPLDAGHAADLLAGALGATPPPDLSRAVLARVGGHPLMAVQSAAYLLESGIVAVEQDVCEVRSPSAVDVLPTSLRLFVAARIDRLPTDEKAALQELSTYGEAVDATVLKQVSGSRLGAATASLVGRGLLRETGGGWQFSHGMVQQVAYASLPRSVRAELHRRQFHHYANGATGERMAHALRWATCVPDSDSEQRNEAVAAALHAVAEHAAVLFGTQAAAALSVIRQAGGLLEDNLHRFPNEICRIQTLASRCFLELGRFEEALQSAEAAVDTAGATATGSRDRSGALLAKGHALSRLRRFQAARQVLDEALATAERTRDERTRGQALRVLGDTWRQQSFPDFVALTEQAYDVLRAAGDDAGAAECAWILTYLSSTSTVARYSRWRAAALAALPADDLRGKLWLARAAAESAWARMQYDEAWAAATEAVRLGDLLGATDGVADGLTITIHAGVSTGRLDEAVAAFERLRALAVTTANPRMRLIAAAAGAVALFRAGRLVEAEQEIGLARAAAEGFGAGEVAEVAVDSWLLARDRGRWREAASWVARAIEAASQAEFGLEVLSLRVAEAVTYAQLGEPPGVDYLVRLADDCDQAGSTSLASYTRAVMHQLAGQVSGDDPPPASPEEAAVRAETSAMTAPAADAPARWQAAATAWRRLGHTVWLARAQARAGDVAAAEQTLALIGAGDEGRAWALGG